MVPVCAAAGHSAAAKFGQLGRSSATILRLHVLGLGRYRCVMHGIIAKHLICDNNEIWSKRLLGRLPLSNFLVSHDFWFEYDQLSGRDSYCLSGKWTP
jgi:hypothetical protein